MLSVSWKYVDEDEPLASIEVMVGWSSLTPHFFSKIETNELRDKSLSFIAIFNPRE